MNTYFIIGFLVTFILIVKLKKYHCLECGHRGSSKGAVNGSTILEGFLWLSGLIFPFIWIIAAIYTVYRFASSHRICPVCKSKRIIHLQKYKNLIIDEKKHY
jgi:hypothetical protein